MLRHFGDQKSTHNTSSFVAAHNSMKSSYLPSLTTLVVALGCDNSVCSAFAPSTLSRHHLQSSAPSHRSSSQPTLTSTTNNPHGPVHNSAASNIQLHISNGSPDAPKTPEEDAALQWDLFTRHHVEKDGEWWERGLRMITWVMWWILPWLRECLAVVAQ